jgi:hypothetical protein
MLHSETVIARAAYLGHDPDCEYTPFVGVPVKAAGGSALAVTPVDRIAGAQLRALRGMRPKPIIGSVGDFVVALIPRDLQERSVEILLEYGQRPNHTGVKWINGMPAPSLRETPTQLRVALRAARLVSPDSPGVVYLENLGVPGLLLEAGVTDRMLTLAETTLGAVLRDDRAKNGELLATLVEWFRCEMSTRATATRLFVHPNTVSYRLRRVGELAGLKLTDPGDLMSVRLALDILQIRGLADGDLDLAPNQDA